MNAWARNRDTWRDDQQASRPAGAGRHTLGSDHDSPRPPAPGQSAESAAQMAAAHREAITHPVWWRSTRERTRDVEGELGRVIRQLCEHVQIGWQSVATLQIASEAIAEGKPADERVANLTLFVLRDFVGAFHRCAVAASSLVPGAATPNDGVPLTDEAAESFHRYLNVLYLTAADPAVPQGMAETIRTATEVLADWGPEFAVLCTASAAERAGCEGAGGAE